MSSERWVTRAEAAELRRCSTDTIRRSQNAGDYPNHRTDDDGVWHIPLSELVAAGHLDPTAPVPAPAPDDIELSAAAPRIARLEAALERAESEIEFQRALLLQLTAPTKATS